MKKNNNNLLVKYHFSHFTDEKTNVQRGKEVNLPYSRQMSYLSYFFIEEQ